MIEEVSNALLTGVRRRHWSGAAAHTAHTSLRQWPVSLVDESRDLDRAWDLARRYDNHPMYDLLYVALAERRRTQLVTADLSLKQRLVPLGRLITPDELLGQPGTGPPRPL
jgi:predicted nucleic acid-binding protein